MRKLYLPKLDKIYIRNYSLYLQQPSFEFEFLNGISSIIGVNGIGKTTFIEIIMYSLLGSKKKYRIKKGEEVAIADEKSFFKPRMDDSYEYNNDASVQLKFKINTSSIVISRSLYENKILNLEVNNIKIENVNDKMYEEMILNLTGISSFKFLEEIVRTFLFFDESRKNIAWEPETQDKLLRRLFFDDEFFERYEFLEKETIKWDSTARHLSEDRRMENESYMELVKERERLINQYKSDTDETELLKLFDQKNKLQGELENLQLQLEEKLEKYNYQNNILNDSIAEKDGILLNAEKVNDNISKLEGKLFSTIYDRLPKYYIDLERTITTQGKCPICSSKNKDIQEVANQKSKNGKCLICSSTIKTAEEMDPKLIDKINNLTKIRDELTIKLKNKIEQLNDLENVVNELNKIVKEENECINEKKRQIMNIDSLIAKNNTDEKKSDTYTEILKIRQQRIDELVKKTNEAYQKSNEYKEELMNEHRKFKNTVEKLNKSLSVYFNKYASAFTGFECELVVEDKKVNKIPHAIYLPRVKGTVRRDIWAVSESQRFFLDQAFRMAIIDYLQSNISGFETFFITETPEGTLDITYEIQAAKMFKIFAKSKNNIVFTSNLNSSRFLKEVLNEIPDDEKESRILNLLEKGKISKVQKDNYTRLEEIIEEVLGSVK